METGDDYNPLLLNFEEYSVGKASHSGTATATMDNRELQWMLGDGLYGCLDRHRETLA